MRLAADRIDVVLQGVAASTRAVGEELALRPGEETRVTEKQREHWEARSRVLGTTTEYRTWSGPEPPPFQAPFAGLYGYGDGELKADGVAQLEALERLVPVVRSAYLSYPFSWVYVSTAEERMLIYPYLPLGEAVNNLNPSHQIYYKAADFAHRKVGWTPPYLDLVGAGMMITASYPVYSGDRLLGVASRDITLKQLARSAMSHLTRGNGASALLVDAQGLVIDASDPGLVAELQEVNTKARAAVLYYRTGAGLKARGAKAVASATGWVNEVTERVIAEATRKDESDVMTIDAAGHEVLAARVATTGWLLILVQAP
jgi:hypothetical protein